MLRKEIEQYMKENKLTQIDLVIKEDDLLGIYCALKNGILKDYTDHAVNRKIDIWGYLEWKDGKFTRRAW